MTDRTRRDRYHRLPRSTGGDRVTRWTTEKGSVVIVTREWEFMDESKLEERRRKGLRSRDKGIGRTKKEVS